MDEFGCPGAELQLRARCPMTTVDPDTLERDPEVLQDIGRRFGGRLALNAEVLRPGAIRIGDAYEARSGLSASGFPRNQ